MVKVIGVRLRKAGRIYYFSSDKFEIKQGQHVIVETARGVEYAKVALGTREVPEENIVQPLKKIMRIATDADAKIAQQNKIKSREAFKICLEKIRKRKLAMKLIDAEYTFDNNKLLFYFTADGRIDFRELVKDLAAVFRTRIELRQVGVRDEAKIIGSIGMCGRTLCCHSFLPEFMQVSIKMAKEQNISLNPTKISGICGRLMCCLKYEEETYEELNASLPHVGDTVTTPEGNKGEAINVNVLKQRIRVKVELEEGRELKEYHVSELKFKVRQRKENFDIRDAELKKLEALERKEGKSLLEDE